LKERDLLKNVEEQLYGSAAGRRKTAQTSELERSGHRRWKPKFSLLQRERKNLEDGHRIPRRLSWQELQRGIWVKRERAECLLEGKNEEKSGMFAI